MKKINVNLLVLLLIWVFDKNREYDDGLDLLKEIKHKDLDFYKKEDVDKKKEGMHYQMMLSELDSKSRIALNQLAPAEKEAVLVKVRVKKKELREMWAKLEAEEQLRMAEEAKAPEAPTEPKPEE